MSSTAPTLPVSLAANPRLSSWVKFGADGQVTLSPGKVEIGQGIVTALAQIAADELDVDIGRVQDGARDDGGKPERRRHLRQPVDPAIRPRDPGGLRRDPADLPRRGLRQARRRRRRARRSRTARSPVPAMSGPAIGNWPSEVSLDRDATPGAKAKPIAKRALAGQRGAAARHSRQGVRPSALHPRHWRCPGCCMAG